MLKQILSIPLTDLLPILLPCLVLFLIVWFRQRRAEESGAENVRGRDLGSWRSRFGYVGRLMGFAAVSLVVISLAVMIYQNNRAANNHIKPSPSQVEVPEGFIYPLEAVEFETSDGLALRGWLIDPSQPATIILLHGYGSNRLSMLWHAEQLAEAGLGVLLYDERASGESEGSHRSYGWQDPVDVLAALDFLQSRQTTADSRLGIVGCSIGGQIALQAAARDARLEAVWADGPSVVRAADLPSPHNWASAIAMLSNHIFDWIFAAKLAALPPDPLVSQLPHLAGRPVQFIAGGTASNALGPEALLAEKYAAKAGPDAEIWVIQEAVHCDGPEVAPEAYARRLVDFFQQSLLP